MRIGFLTTSFPTRAQDEAGSFVLGMAEELVRRGHTIEVLAPEPALGRDPPRWPGIDVRWVAYMRPRAFERTFYASGAPDNMRLDGRAWFGAATFPCALLTAALDRRRNWDALLSHWLLPCGAVGSFVADGRPHLAIGHSADVHLLRKLPLRRLLGRHMIQGSTQCVFVSTDLREKFLSLASTAEKSAWREHTTVQPMGVQPSTFVERADRALLRRKHCLSRFTLLSLSRLVPLKGLEHVLPAIEALPGTEWLIAGDGPDRPRLERLAAPLASRVRFLGAVHGHKKWELLHAADAFVAPSIETRTGRTEGTPVAVLEAMVSGLPVIGSAVGGLGEILAGGRGLTVRPGNARDIVDAIVRLRQEPTLQQNVRHSAAAYGQSLTWPRVGDVIERLLTAPRPAHDMLRHART